MICKNCGFEVDDNDVFCGHCGKRIYAETNISPQNVSPIIPTKSVSREEILTALNGKEDEFLDQDINTSIKPSNISSTPQVEVGNRYGYIARDRSSIIAKAENDGHGMKWYKFVIYFRIFIIAISGLSGILMLNGYHYDIVGNFYEDGNGGMSSLIYSMYPALKTYDKIYGIFLILIAIACFFIRPRLASFKQKADHQYLLLIIIGAISSIIHLVITSIILKNTPEINDIFTTVILIVVCACEYIYFNKRSYLFTN